MTGFLVFLLACPAAASRSAAPLVAVRAPVLPALQTALPVPPLSASSAPALPAAPALTPASAVPADAPTPSPAPESAPADGLLGRTVRTLAALPSDHRDWDRTVFEELFSGRSKGSKPWADLSDSPNVSVGETLVDRRAPGARELLKTLVLPDKRPVIGLVERASGRILNGIALGTRGIGGHRDAAPLGADARELGGYVLRLDPNGRVRVLSSGSFPTMITPALVRALRRYFGLTPIRETASARLKRGFWRAWDALAVLPVAPKPE